MTNKLKLGFVGVGSMGQMAHLRNYATDETCVVTAIAELRKETAERVARRYGIDTVYSDARTMLEREHLDAIVASQPFTRHRTVLNDILPYGKPVFLEKPLASSIQIGEALVESAAQYGSLLMVGYHKRSDPATMLAKAEIDRLKKSGELGQLTYIRILMPAGDWIAHGFDELIQEEDNKPVLTKDPAPDDMNDATYGEYVSFINYYIHQVNLLRHLFGEDYEIEFTDKQGRLLVVRSDSGATGTIEMSPYRTTIEWQEEILVCFERGWIRLSLPPPLVINQAGSVEIYRDPGNGSTPVRDAPILPRVHAMKQQSLNFLAAVRGEVPPMTGAAEALSDLRIARDYIRMRYET